MNDNNGNIQLHEGLYQYKITTTYLQEEQISTYGLIFYDSSNNICFQHDDLWTKSSKCIDFIHYINTRDVSFIHIKDLLEDLIDSDIL